jgi:transposase InsO family protein
MPIAAMPSRRLLEEMCGAALESRLEEMGVLRSFSRARVSNDNPYAESPFRTVKHRHRHSGSNS